MPKVGTNSLPTCDAQPHGRGAHLAVAGAVAVGRGRAQGHRVDLHQAQEVPWNLPAMQGIFCGPASKSRHCTGSAQRRASHGGSAGVPGASWHCDCNLGRPHLMQPQQPVAHSAHTQTRAHCREYAAGGSSSRLPMYASRRGAHLGGVVHDLAQPVALDSAVWDCVPEKRSTGACQASLTAQQSTALCSKAQQDAAPHGWCRRLETDDGRAQDGRAESLAPRCSPRGQASRRRSSPARKP